MARRRRKFREGYDNSLKADGIGLSSGLMLSKLQYLVEGFFESSAGVFKRAGLTPNWATFLGLAFTILASIFYYTGLPSLSVWIGTVVALLLAGYFDALDGALARRFVQVSKMGGVLDSVFDRIGEVAVYASIALGGLASFPLCLWALSASLMVSYVRARVETEGVTLKGIGLAERPERLLFLLVSTILVPLYRNSLLVGVGVVALLASITVVERVFRASRLLSQKG